MTYLLVIMLWVPAQPVTIKQIGPFHDVFACERAAAQALIFQTTHERVHLETFCAVTRSPYFRKPK